MKDETQAARPEVSGRFVLTCLTVILCVTFPVAVHADDPVGDYGDAPDAPAHQFPTKFATTNSRLEGPGVHHLTTGLEMLGTAVSAEAGAEDLADPDGVQNLVDNDDHDDGLLGIMITQWGAPFGRPMVRFTAQVKITIDAGAPTGKRYLNVLVDTNRDQVWRNTGDGAEWVVVNQEVDIAPGTTQTLWVPFGLIPDPDDPSTPEDEMWIRMTLSRTKIDVDATVDEGGWDGSGAFAFGETEDYAFSTVTIIPPPLDCYVRAECDPCELKLDHFGPGGDVKVRITLHGTECAGCNIAFNPANDWEVAKWGGAVGLGIENGARPGNITANPIALPIANGMEIRLHINTVCTPPDDCDIPGKIQAFAVKFKFRVEDAFGNVIMSGTRTCDVFIFHEIFPFFGEIDFGGDDWRPPDEPIDFVPSGVDPLPPTAPRVVFGNSQPTTGTVRCAHYEDYPPGLTDTTGVLAQTTFLDVGFDLDEYWTQSYPEVETQISGLHLKYTESMLMDAGIVDENLLEPFKMPYYPDSFFDIFYELTTDVGSYYTVHTGDNIIKIQNPSGFSIWGIRGPTAPAVESAVSVRTHGDKGDFAVDVFNGEIECRTFGVTKLVVGFDMDIQRINGDFTDVELSSSGSAGPPYRPDIITQTASNELTIEMSGTTDATPLIVSFPGIADAGNVSYICADSVCILQMIGDVNPDLVITSQDRVFVRDQIGTAVSASNFRMDVRADGTFNSIDRVDVRDAMGTPFVGSCP